MRKFCFDARATLTEIRNQTRPFAIVAIPAIVPTAVGPEPASIATIASIADPPGEIRKLPDLDAFAERAAVVEFDGGLARPEAEALAAKAQGFTDAGALFDAAALQWLTLLDVLAGREHDPKGARYISAARAFTAEGWAWKAIALGWSELALFGLCPCAPWVRLDRMGAAWSGPAKAITAETIAYPSGGRFVRAQQALGATWSKGTSG